MNEPTIALPSLIAMLQLAKQHGVEAAEMLAACGLRPDFLQPVANLPATERRVPLEALLRAWELLFERTGGDRSLPLAIAGGFRPEHYDVLGFVVGTAETCREAWRRASRFMAAWSDNARFHLEETDPARVVFDMPPPSRIGAMLSHEAVMAESLCFAKSVMSSFAPLSVRYRHQAPPDLTAHRTFNGVEVEFSAPRYEIEFDRALLDSRLPPTPPAIAAYFLREAEALLARLPESISLAREVRRILAVEIGAGDPTQACVARRLAMSERTLRRRLVDEGTSFLEILDDVRHRAAERYLHQGRLGTTEIAFALGFTDVSAFYRAFKRWTGKTPGEVRIARAG